MRKLRFQFVAAASALALILGVTGAQALGPRPAGNDHSTGSTYDFFDARSDIKPVGAPGVL
jgi:hypothetical protein